MRDRRIRETKWKAKPAKHTRLAGALLAANVTRARARAICTPFLVSLSPNNFLYQLGIYLPHHRDAPTQ